MSSSCRNVPAADFSLYSVERGMPPSRSPDRSRDICHLSMRAKKPSTADLLRRARVSSLLKSGIASAWYPGAAKVRKAAIRVSSLLLSRDRLNMSIWRHVLEPMARFSGFVNFRPQTANVFTVTAQSRFWKIPSCGKISRITATGNACRFLPDPNLARPTVPVA